MAGTSRMSREAHVRICGGLEVRLLRSTRPAVSGPSRQLFLGSQHARFRESDLSDFLNVSDTTQAKFAKIPIARVIFGAIQ